jgi:ABC-type Na+ efflux pump permease subunit
VRTRRLEREQIDPVVAAWIQEPLRFELRKVTAAGEAAEVTAQDRLRQWAPLIFVYLLWISVFSISQMLLTNTVEEKSNRIIEVLLSSVSPVELMAGKIAGIAQTGFTIIVAWLLSFFVITKYVPGWIGVPSTLDLSVLTNDPVYLTSFVAYFLLGYLLFAAMLVGIGAVCNTLKEAQNLMGPITILLILPLLAMVPIGKDPNGALAKVLSFIPPFTPFVMMNRAAGPPAPWEYVATTALLLVSIAVSLWAAAKVFRIGVLLTGKPPKLGEILRWIRAPVGVVVVRRES